MQVYDEVTDTVKIQGQKYDYKLKSTRFYCKLVMEYIPRVINEIQNVILLVWKLNTLINGFSSEYINLDDKHLSLV